VWEDSGRWSNPVGASKATTHWILGGCPAGKMAGLVHKYKTRLL
jgi:hypothetical protein